jgi:hypothetical protein
VLDLCTAGFVLLLAIWFVLSVVNQLGWRWFRRLQYADLLQLLPLWNFFAPNPGVQDYYLLYRDEDQGHKIGDWHLVQPTESRRWISCLWNPAKVENKVLSDLVQMLTEYQAMRTKDSSAIMLSVPYLFLLKMATEAPRKSTDRFRQFLLTQKQGLDVSDKFVAILLSDLHSLE